MHTFRGGPPRGGHPQASNVLGMPREAATARAAGGNFKTSPPMAQARARACAHTRARAGRAHARTHSPTRVLCRSKRGRAPIRAASMASLLDAAHVAERHPMLHTHPDVGCPHKLVRATAPH